jgi:hypothetical protein
VITIKYPSFFEHKCYDLHKPYNTGIGPKSGLRQVRGCQSNAPNHPTNAIFWMGRGNSNTYMGGRPEEDPLHGICQGNGAGPAMWLVLSLLMAKIYMDNGHSSSIISPITKEEVRFMGEMFVDDTGLLTILPGIYDVQEVMDVAQCNLDKMTKLLIATVGALNPIKCYWYLVLYKLY